MNAHDSRLVRLVLAGMAAAAIGASAGCYATMEGQATVPVAEVHVRSAPPPARVEVIPVAPAPEYVWVPGYWDWSGTTYVWISGRYVAAEDGYVWVRPRYVHRANGVVYVRGYWRHPSHGRDYHHDHGRHRGHHDHHD